MFLIKKICVNNMERRVHVEDGITVVKGKISPRGACHVDFWGEMTLNSGAFPEKECTETKVISCQSYHTSPIGDGYIDLMLFDEDKNQFLKTNTDDEMFVGYLIFVEKCLKDIKTNVKPLFMRYTTEIVCVLRNNGDYIEVDGFRFEYEDKRVSYKTYI